MRPSHLVAASVVSDLYIRTCHVYAYLNNKNMNEKYMYLKTHI